MYQNLNLKKIALKSEKGRELILFEINIIFSLLSD